MTPDVLDFFVLAGKRKGLALEGDEARIAELLAERPRSRSSLAQACHCLAPQLLRIRRLEEIGLVRRSGVTPTDAMHVLGTFTLHDVEAARLGVRILGRFVGLEETPAADAIVEEVERLLALCIMRRELTADGGARWAESFDEVRPLLEKTLSADGRRPSSCAGGRYGPWWASARRWARSCPAPAGGSARAHHPGGCGRGQRRGRGDQPDLRKRVRQGAAGRLRPLRALRAGRPRGVRAAGEGGEGGTHARGGAWCAAARPASARRSGRSASR